MQSIAEDIRGGNDSPPPIVGIEGDMSLSSDISTLPADALAPKNAIDIVKDMIREIQRSVTPDVEMTELMDPSDTKEDVNALESSVISAVENEQEAGAEYAVGTFNEEDEVEPQPQLMATPTTISSVP